MMMMMIAFGVRRLLDPMDDQRMTDLKMVHLEACDSSLFRAVDYQHLSYPLLDYSVPVVIVYTTDGT